MKFRPLLVLLALLALSCSSNNSTQPPSDVPFEGNLGVRFIGHAEDTIVVTGQGPALLDLQITSNGKPVDASTGVSTYYYDPILQQYEVVGSRIPLWLHSSYPHDTSFAIDFRIDVLGTTLGPLRKYFDVRLHVGPPIAPVQYQAVDDHSYEVRWVRVASDDATDTIIVRSRDGIESYAINSPDTSFLYTKAKVGRFDTLELHTLGGTVGAVSLATPLNMSPVFRLRGYPTQDYPVGIQIGPAAVKTVDTKGLDSNSVVFDMRNPEYPELTSPAALQSRGASALFSPLKFGTIDTATIGPFLETQIPADSATTRPMYASVAFSPNFQHYSLIEIEPQPNGRLVGSDAVGKFIDVRVRIVR